MKIKALAALCSKRKTIVIFDDLDRQWAGDGVAAFLLPQVLGGVDLTMLCVVLDIPSGKAADFSTRHVDMPEDLCTEDDDDREEELIFDTDCRILYNGKDLVPLRTASGKIYFIKTKYLKPLEDSEQLRLSLRNAETRPIVVAKDGMFLAGLIAPETISMELSGWLQQVHSGAASTVRYENETLDGEE